MMQWTNEMEKQIISLRLSGEPFKKIAEVMTKKYNSKFTKNMVVAKYNRKCGKPLDKPRSDKKPIAKYVVGKNVVDFKPSKKIVVPEGAPQPIGPMNDMAVGCKFIYGDVVAGAWRCCGHENKTGKPWCSYHYDIVYNRTSTAASDKRYKEKEEKRRIAP